MSDPVGNPEDWFPHVAVHVVYAKSMLVVSSYENNRFDFV